MSRKLPKIIMNGIARLSIFVCLLGCFLLFILLLKSGQIVDLSGFQTKTATAEWETFRCVSLFLLVELEQGAFDPIFASHHRSNWHLSVRCHLFYLVESFFVIAHRLKHFVHPSDGEHLCPYSLHHLSLLFLLFLVSCHRFLDLLINFTEAHSLDSFFLSPGSRTSILFLSQLRYYLADLVYKEGQTPLKQV